jgi:hypothetical protein
MRKGVPNCLLSTTKPPRLVLSFIRELLNGLDPALPSLLTKSRELRIFTRLLDPSEEYKKRERLEDA